MVASVQNYTVKGSAVAIDLTTVPVLSENTLKILTAFQMQLPHAFQDAADLKDRIQNAASWSIARPLKRLFQIALGGFVYSESLAECCRGEKSMYLLPTAKAVQNFVQPYFQQFQNFQFPNLDEYVNTENLMYAAAFWSLFSVVQLLTDSYLEKRALRRDLEKDQKTNQSWIEFDREYFLAETPNFVGCLRQTADDFQAMKSVSPSAEKEAFYEQDRQALIQAANEIHNLYSFYHTLIPNHRKIAA